MRALGLVATLIALLATLAFTTAAHAAVPHDGTAGWATVAEKTGYTYFVPLAPLFPTSFKASGYGWVPTTQDTKSYAAMMTGTTVNYVYVVDICGSGFVWAWYENKWWSAYATHFNMVPGYFKKAENWSCATAA